MWGGVVVKGESCSQISFQVLNFLNVLQKLCVNLLLSCLGCCFPLDFSLLSFFNSFQSCFWCVLQLGLSPCSLSLEPSVIDVSFNSVQWNIGWGGNDVSWVDSLQWNSVDGVWASYQKAAWSECFKYDDSSSSVSSWQKDDNITRLNWCSTGGWSGVSIFSLM